MRTNRQDLTLRQCCRRYSLADKHISLGLAQDFHPRLPKGMSRQANTGKKFGRRYRDGSVKPLAPRTRPLPCKAYGKDLRGMAHGHVTLDHTVPSHCFPGYALASSCYHQCASWYQHDDNCCMMRSLQRIGAWILVSEGQMVELSIYCAVHSKTATRLLTRNLRFVLESTSGVTIWSHAYFGKALTDWPSNYLVIWSAKTTLRVVALGGNHGEDALFPRALAGTKHNLGNGRLPSTSIDTPRHI
nr:hypothetical protein CFP56_00677 [Quercus suber]